MWQSQSCYKNFQWFRPNKDVKREGGVSPTLLRIYLEQALKRCKQKWWIMGVSLKNTTWYILSFTDDQILMAQDHDDMKYITRKLFEENNKLGLVVIYPRQGLWALMEYNKNLSLITDRLSNFVKNIKINNYSKMRLQTTPWKKEIRKVERLCNASQHSMERKDETEQVSYI